MTFVTIRFWSRLAPQSGIREVKVIPVGATPDGPIPVMSSQVGEQRGLLGVTNCRCGGMPRWSGSITNSTIYFGRVIMHGLLRPSARSNPLALPLSSGRNSIKGTCWSIGVSSINIIEKPGDAHSRCCGKSIDLIYINFLYLSNSYIRQCDE